MILIDRPSDGVVVISFNRPEVHNALSMALQRELDDRLTEIDADRSVRCIVFTGAGGAAFSAGYDIHELAAMSPDEITLALMQREEWMWRYASLRMPTIAALPGITYGAGALMACALDMRLGCENTTFKVTAGRYAGANATWSLPQLVGVGMAKEILYTSRVVTAEEGLRIGLLNRVVPADRLQAEALALAESIAANPPEGIEQVKRLVHDGPGRRLQDRYEAENVVMRTTLRPRPMGELFAGFLSRDGVSPDGGTTDNGRPL